MLAAGGDLSPRRLLNAYRAGIFPWFNQGEPILWWSPNPRMVLFPKELTIARSLHKTLKKHHYEIRTDSVFTSVMQACAAPRKAQSSTWIHPEMILAYTALHERGIAHSVETWINGKLAGDSMALQLEKCFLVNQCFPVSRMHQKLPLCIWLSNWNAGILA